MPAKMLATKGFFLLYLPMFKGNVVTLPLIIIVSGNK